MHDQASNRRLKISKIQVTRNGRAIKGSRRAWGVDQGREIRALSLLGQGEERGAWSWGGLGKELGEALDHRRLSGSSDSLRLLAISALRLLLHSISCRSTQHLHLLPLLGYTLYSTNILSLPCAAASLLLYLLWMFFHPFATPHPLLAGCLLQGETEPGLGHSRITGFMFIYITIDLERKKKRKWWFYIYIFRLKKIFNDELLQNIYIYIL